VAVAACISRSVKCEENVRLDTEAVSMPRFKKVCRVSPLPLLLRPVLNLSAHLLLGRGG
jgi:hypothetical protein